MNPNDYLKFGYATLAALIVIVGMPIGYNLHVENKRQVAYERCLAIMQQAVEQNNKFAAIPMCHR